MKTVIVLAMHGVPPKDFPRNETGELFRLNAQLEHMGEAESVARRRRYAELDAKVRAWPRTAENDPYYTWSKELGAKLSKVTGDKVIVGFNEFCGPSLDEALDQAIALNADKIVVITPMMTRGGEHSEIDIPAAIKRAQEKYPEKPIIYAWPFDVTEVAGFLAEHIAHFE